MAIVKKISGGGKRAANMKKKHQFWAQLGNMASVGVGHFGMLISVGEIVLWAGEKNIFRMVIRSTSDSQ